MATETGIRSSGPGKFNYIIDEYVYEAALNQGTPDEEISHEGFGWFALVELDDSARKFIREFAADEEDELTSEEEELLDDSGALILHERSDGIVEVDWYDTSAKARKVWADLEEELSEEDEDDDEEEEESEEEDDFDLESEMEDALVIGDTRGGYAVSLSGKHIGDFDDFDDALAAGVQEMHKSNYFPNVFYVNERGNTDLLTVKYELQDGQPVNIESTTVRSWV